MTFSFSSYSSHPRSSSKCITIQNRKCWSSSTCTGDACDLRSPRQKALPMSIVSNCKKTMPFHHNRVYAVQCVTQSIRHTSFSSDFSSVFFTLHYCTAIAVMDINTDSNRLHYGMSLNDAFGNVLSCCNRFSLTHITINIIWLPLSLPGGLPAAV